MTTLSISFFCFAFTGCSEKASAPAVAELKPIESDSSAQGIATSVSKEQAEEFAAQLESAVSNGDAAGASKLVLMDRILDRVISKLKITGKDKDTLKKGMSVQNPITTVFGQIAASIPQGGSYKFVRTAVRGDEMHVIYRMMDPAQGMNYHDFRLITYRGEVKADQLFLAATGESFTDSLINMLGPSARAQQSSLGRLNGDAAKKLKALDQQVEMFIAARTGDPKKALAIYEMLPTEIKESKITQLMRVKASESLPEEKYVAAMTEYANRFPDDPSVALMAFDKAVLNEDVAATKKCLATLTVWTGGDDHLNLLVAALVAQWGDTDYAKELYENVNAAKVKMFDAHDYKMTAALFCNDFPVVAQELSTLRDEYGWEGDLSSDPDFAEFLKSPEFAAFEAN